MRVCLIEKRLGVVGGVEMVAVELLVGECGPALGWVLWEVVRCGAAARRLIGCDM